VKRKRPLQRKKPHGRSAGVKQHKRIERKTPLPRGKGLRAKPKPVDEEARGLAGEWYRAVVPAKLRRTHQGHHVIPQQTLKNLFPKGHGGRSLPQILWDERNGMAVPNRDHERHTVAFKKIPRSEVPASVFEFAAELEIEWYLDKHYPA
jgi:hypothetical protein